MQQNEIKRMIEEGLSCNRLVKESFLERFASYSPKLHVAKESLENVDDFKSRNQKKRYYEKPQIEVVEMELQNLLLASSDPTITNPDMEWGAKEKRGTWGNLWETED